MPAVYAWNHLFSILNLLQFWFQNSSDSNEGYSKVVCWSCDVVAPAWTEICLWLFTQTDFTMLGHLSKWNASHIPQEPAVISCTGCTCKSSVQINHAVMNSHCLDFEGRLSLHPNGSKLRSHACWALGKSLPAAAGLVHILPGCIMLHLTNKRNTTRIHMQPLQKPLQEHLQY